MDEITRLRHADNRKVLVEAIDVLKERWSQEDEALVAERAALMERYEQGLRDLDALVSPPTPVESVAAVEPVAPVAPVAAPVEPPYPV